VSHSTGYVQFTPSFNKHAHHDHRHRGERDWGLVERHGGIGFKGSRKGDAVCGGRRGRDPSGRATREGDLTGRRLVEREVKGGPGRGGASEAIRALADGRHQVEGRFATSHGPSAQWAAAPRSGAGSISI